MSSPQEFEEVENSLDSAEGRDFDELARLFHRALWARESHEKITEMARKAAWQAINLEKLKRSAILAYQQNKREEGKSIEKQAEEDWEKFSKSVDEILGLIWADLFCIARTFVHNDADAKDSAQKASEKIFKNFDSFDADKGRFRTWYFKITKHTALDVGRVGSRWQRRRELPYDGNDESEATSESESVRIVDDVLKRMPEDCRSRLKHLYPRGSKVGGHKEIATALQEDYEASKKRTQNCIEMAKKLFHTLATQMSSNAT